MLLKSKVLLLFVLVCLTIGGCATTQEDIKVKTCPAEIQYVCAGCGNKIKRDGEMTKGFMSACPRCGKKFLAF
ncbi:MAG: hypothetical protein P9M13_04025 [Candidatus Ancaeobacter aquaticus]|nr:hypothetical protein [Candidatus Ancaeobacter aquaticus]